MKLREQQILLVEDDPDVRVLLRTVLEHAGYAVLAVDNVRTALNVLETASYDVLVSDYHLPDGLGIALIGQARTELPEMATVLISAEPGVEYLAYQCGANAWFRKGEMLSGFLVAVTSAIAEVQCVRRLLPGVTTGL